MCEMGGGGAALLGEREILQGGGGDAGGRKERGAEGGQGQPKGSGPLGPGRRGG